MKILTIMSTSDHIKSTRQNKKRNMVTAFGGKCQCCGYSTSMSALEVHHINPRDKTKEFSLLTRNNRKMLDFIEELEKCVLLCCNCHREVHDGTLKVPENYQRFDMSLIPSKAIKPKKKRPSKINISKEELGELLKTSATNIELGKQLGVSDSFISRLRKKIKSSKSI